LASVLILYMPAPQQGDGGMCRCGPAGILNLKTSAARPIVSAHGGRVSILDKNNKGLIGI